VTTIAEAEDLLEETGLNLAVIEVEDHRPEGTIVGQDPNRGHASRSAASCSCRSPTAPARLPTVPGVVGLDEDEAIRSWRMPATGRVLYRPTNREDRHGWSSASRRGPARR
jgi:beta-lactam-binding protein with PASTA domain